MNYIDNQAILKEIFTIETDQIKIPDSGISIRNFWFRSMQGKAGADYKEENPDNLLTESLSVNNYFRYPVFVPGGVDKCKGAIVMMHGLNERNWIKYLSWAQNLAEKTGKAVILFPLAFHINRSPDSWSDPRIMKNVADARHNLSQGNSASTVFNAALSERLDQHPEWFCSSGLQSSYDIIALTRSIQSGTHPLFEAGSRVDFFAYSVGAFLLEVLLIANPDEIFSESKSFLFLGGSAFEQMKGISRFILDARAFDKLEEAFIRENPSKVREKINLPREQSFNSLWLSFLSMLRLDNMQSRRERALSQMAPRVLAIALSTDTVIPAKSIRQTLQINRRKQQIPVEVMDFPYPCIHENPFPVKIAGYGDAVNVTFERVFSKAAAFLPS